METASKRKKIFDGRYEVLSIVGRGAASVVYHARHAVGTPSEVALKVLLNQGNDAANSERLRKEALAIVSSRHKYVVRLDDFHSVKDLCYLAMEYAREGDLRKYLEKSQGKLAPKQAELFFNQAAQALNFIHKVGIVHRDIKPDNILVLNPNEIRIADFGVAVLPGENASLEELRKGVGTMSYMAPEVLEGKSYDRRSDIYALGVTFYEMITGKHPFDNAPLIKQLEVREDHNLIPVDQLVPKVSPALAEVIMRCMSFNPERRFRSLVEAIDILGGPSATVNGGASKPPVNGARGVPNGTKSPASATPQPQRSAPSAGGPGEQLAANASKPSQPTREAPRGDTRPASGSAPTRAGAAVASSANAAPGGGATQKPKPSTGPSSAPGPKMRPPVVPFDPNRGKIKTPPASPAAGGSASAGPRVTAAAPGTSPVPADIYGGSKSPSGSSAPRTGTTGAGTKPEAFGAAAGAPASKTGSSVPAAGPAEKSPSTAPAGKKDGSPLWEDLDDDLSDDLDDVWDDPFLDEPPAEQKPAEVKKPAEPSITANPAAEETPRQKILLPRKNERTAPGPLKPTRPAAQTQAAEKLDQDLDDLIAAEAESQIEKEDRIPSSTSGRPPPSPANGRPLAAKKLSPAPVTRKRPPVLVIFLAGLAAIYLIKRNFIGDATTPTAVAPPTLTVQEAIPAVSATDLSFPQLPAGLYIGRIEGLPLARKQITLSILSLPEQNALTFIVGVEGWTPQIVSLPAGDSETQSPKIRVVSNGMVFDFVGEQRDGTVVGKVLNVITGEVGQWAVAPVTAW